MHYAFIVKTEPYYTYRDIHRIQEENSAFFGAKMRTLLCNTSMHFRTCCCLHHAMLSWVLLRMHCLGEPYWGCIVLRPTEEVLSGHAILKSPYWECVVLNPTEELLSGCTILKRLTENASSWHFVLRPTEEALSGRCRDYYASCGDLGYIEKRKRACISRTSAGSLWCAVQSSGLKSPLCAPIGV